jgi:hypothetical protein
VSRFGAAILICASIIACQNETHPVFSPAQSPTPHTEPTAAILQASDVPAGLKVCPGSGPIDVYIAVMQSADPSLGGRLTDQWLQMLRDGAVDGAISLFVANPSACKAELGATTGVKAMTSFVAQFGDEATADRAWHDGVFGFVPPPAGLLTPGVTIGSATGLGVSSFTYDRPSVRLACWRHGVFVALVVVSNLDVNTFKAATAAVDPRLN